MCIHVYMSTSSVICAYTITFIDAFCRSMTVIVTDRRIDVYTLAILNKKGGAGKTLVTSSLGVAAAAAGLKVAIADLDPQASACAWADVRETDDLAVVSTVPNRLKKVQTQCEEAGVELLIIDTAPSADSGLLAAARVADCVLMPTRPGLGDLAALRDTLELISTVQVQKAALLNSPKTAALKTEASTAVTSLGVELVPVVFGDRVAFQHAFTSGLGVSEYEPSGKAAGELNRLWKWVSKSMEGS